MADEAPPIGIIMGSQSDWETMRHAAETLDELGIGHETRIVSAHRTPAGICTIESKLSIPFSALDSTGTPSTGSRVIEAAMPGRCAAPPAPAMMTLRPRSAAFFA